MKEMIRKKSILIGAIAISIAAMLWGLDGVVLTPQLHNLDVSFAVLLLHLIPFLIMNTFLYKKYKNIKLLSKKEIIAIILVALFGGALGTIAIVKALFLVNFQHLSVVILIQKLQPVFAILLASILLREKLSKHYILFGSIAIIASYILTFQFTIPSFDSANTNLYAVMFSLLAALSFGSSTVLSKVALQKLDFKTATFFRYGITSLIMLLITTVNGHIIDFPTVTPNNWLILCLIGITTGSGALFLFYYGLKKVRAIISTVCELFFPLSAILFDYLINDYVLSTVQWVAVIVMIVSILALNVQNARKR